MISKKKTDAQTFPSNDFEIDEAEVSVDFLPILKSKSSYTKIINIEYYRTLQVHNFDTISKHYKPLFRHPRGLIINSIKIN